MSPLWLVLAAIAGILVGTLAGFWWGKRCTGRLARFWISVGVLFAACIWAAYVASTLRVVWAACLALGVLAGGLTGLKYGSNAELRDLVTPRSR